MSDQLDLSAGRKERDYGLDRVGFNNQPFLRLMRAVARRIALRRGWVTTDDLREYAKENNVVPSHPNAWGAIFRSSEWKCVGRRRSRVVSNHAREVRVWTCQ